MAIASARRLTFGKRSLDGSGKGTLEPAGSGNDLEAHGVLFEIAASERDQLDLWEGDGYWRDDAFLVESRDRNEIVSATTYLAKQPEPGLIPYDWYLALVLAGAIQNGLPAQYVAALARVATIPDPAPNRASRLVAHRVLNESGFAHLLRKPT